jgi:hypothetical protein
MALYIAHRQIYATACFCLPYEPKMTFIFLIVEKVKRKYFIAYQIKFSVLIKFYWNI